MAVGPHHSRSSRRRTWALAALVLALAVTFVGGLLASPVVGRASAATATEFEAFPLPAGSEPAGVALGPDGNLWIAERGSDRIGRVAASGDVSEFSLPAGSRPESIVAGPEAALWFTEAGAARVGRITTSGQVTEFPIASSAADITPGPDGDLWLTEPTIGMIGRLSTTGELTQFPAGTASGEPTAIVAGPDGNLWFTEALDSTTGPGRVVRMTPEGQATEFSLSAEYSQPSSIVAGPDGNLWFNEGGAPAVGRITTSGEITEFPGLEVDSSAVAGAPGGVWYTALGVVGFVSDEGSISQFPVPFEPRDVAANPDGTLWLTAEAEDGTPEVVRFTPDLAEPAPPPTTPTQAVLCAEGACEIEAGKEGGGQPALQSDVTLAPAALPARFYGLQFGDDYPQSEPDMEAVGRSGAKYWRLNFGCTDNWSESDTEMRLAWEHGLTVIADLVGNCNGSKEYPTKEEYGPAGSAWETWLYELVQHYGPSGTFWSGRANPDPLNVFEIWNEPNRAVNNPGGVKAQPNNYAYFLRRTGRALRAAAGQASLTVLMGGLLTLETKTVTEEGIERQNLSVHDFLQGTTTATEVGYDGVGIHPYAFAVGHEVEKVAENINTARENLEEIPEGKGKPLWITEIGWPVKHGDPAHPQVTPQRQGELINGLVSWVREHAGQDGLKSLVYYNYRDFQASSWEGYCGLRELAGTSSNQTVTGLFRPGWQSFRNATGAANWPVPATVGAPDTPSFVGQNSATVSAPINPRGLGTFAWVEYGTSPAFGSKAWASTPYVGYKEQVGDPPANLPGLSPGTTYHYRFVAFNENEERTNGTAGVFTTRP